MDALLFFSLGRYDVQVFIFPLRFEHWNCSGNQKKIVGKLYEIFILHKRKIPIFYVVTCNQCTKTLKSIVVTGNYYVLCSLHTSVTLKRERGSKFYLDLEIVRKLRYALGGGGSEILRCSFLNFLISM